MKSDGQVNYKCYEVVQSIFFIKMLNFSSYNWEGERPNPSTWYPLTAYTPWQHIQ